MWNDSVVAGLDNHKGGLTYSLPPPTSQKEQPTWGEATKIVCLGQTLIYTKGVQVKTRWPRFFCQKLCIY